MPQASAPEVVKDIEAIAKTLSLPQGLRLIEVYNQGELIRSSILGIRDAIGNRNPADDRRPHLLPARRPRGDSRRACRSRRR
jgi:hypothetical protein